MRYMKKCMLFCCVYILVTGSGILAFRKNKVEGGAIGIQAKGSSGQAGHANGHQVKNTNACGGNNSSGGGGECPLDTHTTSGVQHTEKKPSEASNKSSILDNIIIPEDAFESAKRLCEFVVIKGEHFKAFCKQSIFFKDIQLLKQKAPNLYAQIAGESYENEATSSFQVLKDEGDKKIVMEDDKHNPKMSLFFLYEKMCVGGIPLACANILKVDNVFDMNQTGNVAGGSGDTAEGQDVEGDITGAVEEDGSQGVSENVTDLTEEDSN
ncbi:hypothetical protein AK88_04171 [Plasmodium fragile]|uniref:Rhoptry neck protein 12 n=1 Tax=Plasmodium fragile TaxID=5857 RepID=A0A0D9QGM0_PLAFR|nr:uncharacterized protein AK88_04171 [Plasmodium fragile]KJP86200.1 hypothetical protein AK88_04171 [Plasmodium fragile]